jgi:two-component system response regulator (stage 0 sporulation protein F)
LISRVFKTEEAAKYLSVHVETIRRLARGGEIPAMKVGRGWRFKEDSLVHWAETNHLRLSAPHILIVDDDESVLKVIQRILSKKDYRISTVAQLELALEILEKDTPDAILVTLEIVGMKGRAILNKIYEMGRHMPVIVITDNPGSNLMLQVMRHSPVMVLLKPFENVQVLRAVKLALKG